jgi:hypothetical protein
MQALKDSPWQVQHYEDSGYQQQHHRDILLCAGGRQVSAGRSHFCSKT